MAALTWSSSLGALPLLRSGSLSLNPVLGEAAANLRADLENVEPDAMARAVAGAARGRMRDLITGIEIYRAHPYRRSLPDPPEV